MTKVKAILRSPIFTVVLFVAAAALLLSGTVGATQAAPRIQSQDYRAEVQLTNIETALTEQGTVVEGDGTLLLKSFADANTADGLSWDATANDGAGAVKGFAIGKKYKEELAVRNIANASERGIPQYVRVSVYKYWVDEKGDKVPELDPKYIELNFVEKNGWTIDTASSTRERTVLYYTGDDPQTALLDPQGNSPAFTDTIRISEKVMNATEKAADGSTIDYNNKRFMIKAVVDAVQDHNGEKAMISAWGQTNTGATKATA